MHGSRCCGPTSGSSRRLHQRPDVGPTRDRARDDAGRRRPCHVRTAGRRADPHLRRQRRGRSRPPRRGCVAVVSGELDQMAVGMLYCELLCALQGLAQNDRAESGRRRYERWRGEHDVGSLGGRCRLHRADLWAARRVRPTPKRRPQLACDELRPYLRLEFEWPLTVLGNIKLRHRRPRRGRGSIRSKHTRSAGSRSPARAPPTREGDVAGAASSIRRCARPSPERPVQRGPAEHRPPPRTAPRSTGRDRNRNRRHRASPARGGRARSRSLRSSRARRSTRALRSRTAGFTSPPATRSPRDASSTGHACCGARSPPPTR